jgi:hypothetical protein
MQISKETLEVLHNFATINPNILISPGKQLKTIAEAKNILAQAEVTDEFPREFGIYDLNEFLSVINLIDNAQLTFTDEGHVLVQNSNAKIKYYYSEPEILTTPKKEITMPDPEFTVNITEDQLGQIRKAAAVLGHAELVLTNTKTGIRGEVYDVNDATSNNYSLLIDSDNASTDNFKFIFSITNLKLLPGDYYVNISSELISHWTNDNYPADYYIALEKGSEYNV